MDYNKKEIKEQISLDNVFDLLEEFGAEPKKTEFGIVSSTICHNEPGLGKKKLYYYTNTGLFQCYTNCGSFDIFELVIKIFEIQKRQKINLNAAIRFLVFKFNLSGTEEDFDFASSLDDWKILENYSRIQEIETNNNLITLKPYDNKILERLNYSLKIEPWLREDITEDVLKKARIGYYLGGDQITIPHYDKNGNFIGLRGRTVCQEDADTFGKYRPIKINNVLYTHPLGMNLYGLNWAKENIKQAKIAIVFESEKSVLKYMSYFGEDNNLAVACCGSNLSVQQFATLLELGIQELCIAFDRQFKEIDDEEFKKWTQHLTKLNEKYKKEVLVSFVFDKEKLTGYKDSPIDCGKQIFMELFKKRIYL